MRQHVDRHQALADGPCVPPRGARAPHLPPEPPATPPLLERVATAGLSAGAGSNAVAVGVPLALLGLGLGGAHVLRRYRARSRGDEGLKFLHSAKQPTSYAPALVEGTSSDAIANTGQQKFVTAQL